MVQAQAQIDQLAASMASALSDKTTDGTVAPAALAPKAGFDLDLSGVLPGNSINLSYIDTATNTLHQVTIVRVDDPAALPLPNAGAASNRQVIGINFSGGMASVVPLLNSAFGAANLQFSNPAGSVLRVLDNGTGTATVNAPRLRQRFHRSRTAAFRSSVYRWKFAVHGFDHAERIAADRIGGPN